MKGSQVPVKNHACWLIHISGGQWSESFAVKWTRAGLESFVRREMGEPFFRKVRVFLINTDPPSINEWSLKDLRIRSASGCGVLA